MSEFTSSALENKPSMWYPMYLVSCCVEDRAITENDRQPVSTNFLQSTLKLLNTKEKKGNKKAGSYTLPIFMCASSFSELFVVVDSTREATESNEQSTRHHHLKITWKFHLLEQWSVVWKLINRMHYLLLGYQPSIKYHRQCCIPITSIINNVT